GVTKFHVEDAHINEELRRQATRFGCPDSELDALVTARADALASFWTRVGSRADVQFSPDTGPHGGRAQRVQAKGTGHGIAQWTWLPLHRLRRFEFEIMARSPDLPNLTVALFARESEKPLASSMIKGLSPEWKKFTGTLTVPAELAADAAYKFSLAAG